MRFLERKYGISSELAKRLDETEGAVAQVESWRSGNGFPEASSALVRGYISDLISGKIPAKKA